MKILHCVLLSFSLSIAAGMAADPKEKPGLLDLPPGEPITIRLNGSDTMLQLGLKFQEAYRKARPNVTLAVKGEGSGVGIKALITGECHLAASSRPMRDAELARYMEKHGAAPGEHVVAYNVIGVITHRDNPLDSISIAQLRKVYSKKADWSEFTKELAGEIRVASRSKMSGTYALFRDAVLGKGGPGMGKDITVHAGSKALVDFVGATPSAIGYCDLSYATEKVKVLAITDEDGKAVSPSARNVRSGRYPLRRVLYYYTAAEESPEIALFLKWVKSRAGQAIVKAEKFAPIR